MKIILLGIYSFSTRKYYFPEDKHWTHEPKHGKNTWIIEGRRYRILVWYHGNDHCNPIGILVEAPSYAYIK